MTNAVIVDVVRLASAKGSLAARCRGPILSSCLRMCSEASSTGMVSIRLRSTTSSGAVSSR